MENYTKKFSVWLGVHFLNNFLLTVLGIAEIILSSNTYCNHLSSAKSAGNFSFLQSDRSCSNIFYLLILGLGLSGSRYTPQ
jgi:hypothetical protein